MTCKILRNGIINLILCLMLFSCTNNNEKNAFIEIGKVIDSFKLKKNLETSLIKIKESRSALLDSMQFELRVISRRIQAQKVKDKSELSEFEIKKEIYLQKKETVKNEIDSLASAFDKQIIAQINQYIKDYGEKNKYTYIFGAEGSGAIMYCDSSKNITNSIVNYLNERFDGKEK